MKKKLILKKEIYFFENGVRVEGVHGGIRGNARYIFGDVSNIFGDVSGIKGNIDDCEITDEERSKPVNIKDLIQEVNYESIY
jgi:hypothetical protein